MFWQRSWRVKRIKQTDSDSLSTVIQQDKASQKVKAIMRT